MKYLNILLFLFLSTIVTQSYAAVIADISVENNDGVIIYYNYINDGMELEVTCCSISGWYGSSDYSGNVNIPEEVTYMNRTRKVTAIGHYAFQNCGKLTSVTIPSSVTSIDYGAFHNCGFSNIIIPQSVTFIGNDAFSGCALNSVTIPNNVTSISDNSFSDCRNLSSVTIGSSVTSIGNESFRGCSSLTSITIPSSVTFIGEDAFRSCI